MRGEEDREQMWVKSSTQIGNQTPAKPAWVRSDANKCENIKRESTMGDCIEKQYVSFWIGWVIGLEAGGKEDKTGILASSNEYWMLLNEYWFSAPSFLLGQNCAIFSSVRVTACNTTGWQSTSKLKLGQLKGKFSNINITRSSMDEYSTGSNNHLRSTDLFR